MIYVWKIIIACCLVILEKLSPGSLVCRMWCYLVGVGIHMSETAPVHPTDRRSFGSSAGYSPTAWRSSACWGVLLYWVGKWIPLFAQQASQAARFMYQQLNLPRISHPSFDPLVPQRLLPPLFLESSYNHLVPFPSGVDAPSFRPYCGRCPFDIQRRTMK